MLLKFCSAHDAYINHWECTAWAVADHKCQIVPLGANYINHIIKPKPRLAPSRLIASRLKYFIRPAV